MNCSRANRKIAAVFDLDGTLFTGHFWYGIVKHHLENRVKLPQTIAYLVTHYPLWIGYKINALSEDTFKTRWGEDLAALVKGFSEDDITKLYGWIDEKYLANRLRPDTLELLRHHSRQGHATFILSGSFQGFLETVNGRLGADYVIGTELEITGSRFSGRVKKPMCFGKHKVSLLKKFINDKNLDIDFAASFAYADSATDVSVLESVGNPVASYPDVVLLKIAREKGWKIIPAWAK
jgi:HAD superfamily hydrolase (TIGR01490 family)